MKKLRVVTNKDAEIPIGYGTTIECDGADITGMVMGVEMSISPNSVVKAEVTMASHTDVYAVPFMSEESFLRAAEHYGYKVEKEED